MITLALAAVGEAIGWGGRLWAHYEVCVTNYFNPIFMHTRC
jgi:hypothetical protein